MKTPIDEGFASTRWIRTGTSSGQPPARPTASCGPAVHTRWAKFGLWHVCGGLVRGVEDGEIMNG